jgi:pyruvate/2-oxoglutarate dehydrogenase complex dihydrolipoamide acyltransferase (E2) component
MRIKVKMPKLGLTMTEAKVLEWRKTVNCEVSAGEVLFVVETEKADVEIEAPATGALVEIVGEVGRVYPVGEILAVIQTVGP